MSILFKEVIAMAFRLTIKTNLLISLAVFIIVLLLPSLVN
jgi:hypothetical protein